VALLEMDHGDQSFIIVGDESFSIITSDATIGSTLASRAFRMGSAGGPQPLVVTMLKNEQIEHKDDKSTAVGNEMVDDVLSAHDELVNAQESNGGLEEVPLKPGTVPDFEAKRLIVETLPDNVIVDSVDSNTGKHKNISFATDASLGSDGVQATTISEHQFHRLNLRRNDEGKFDIIVDEIWWDGSHNETRTVSLHKLVHLLTNLTDAQIDEIAKAAEVKIETVPFDYDAYYADKDDENPKGGEDTLQGDEGPSPDLVEIPIEEDMSPGETMGS
jgi:hypothetical protein